MKNTCWKAWVGMTLLVFVFGLVWARTGKAADVKEGLVSWWSFDDGTANDLLGKNNGVLEGNPPFVSGKIGKALKFNGAEDVTLGRSETLSPSTGSFSIALWLKNNDPEKEQQIIWLAMYNRDSESIGTYSDIRIFQGKLEAEFVDYQPLTGAHVRSDFDTSVHYVVVVWDRANNLKLYVDGKETVGEDLSKIMGSHNYTQKTGGWEPHSNRILGGHTIKEAFSGFYGLMDEVRYYGRALTAQEVKELYENYQVK